MNVDASASTSKKPKIFFNISEIASFIGQNKWDYITPFERLWKRNDKEDYNVCLNLIKEDLKDKKEELNVVNDKKVLLQKDLIDKKITQNSFTAKNILLEKKEEHVKKIYDNINNIVEKVSTTQVERINNKLGKDIISMINDKLYSTQSKKKDVEECINKLDISDSTKSDLLKDTESYINKTHGILKEESAIKLFEDKYKVKLNTDQVYNTLLLGACCEMSDYLWYIGGKVDGLHTDYVVEVKNRTKGFFNNVREYENTQIQLYMHLLDINMAKLVEKFNNKIKVTVIYKDDEKVNDIIECLNIFSKSFENFIKGDLSNKIKYINSNENEKQTFLKLLYIEKINKYIHQKHFVNVEKEDVDCLIDDLDDL